MKSFVTGSRAYGLPNEHSDIDLVVLVNNYECLSLVEQAESNNGALNPSGHLDDVSLQFGKLNLIVLTDPEKFALWAKATDDLIARKPVTRSEAVAYHREHVDAELARRRNRANEIEAQACEP